MNVSQALSKLCAAEGKYKFNLTTVPYNESDVWNQTKIYGLHFQITMCWWFEYECKKSGWLIIIVP